VLARCAENSAPPATFARLAADGGLLEHLTHGVRRPLIIASKASGGAIVE
jgi:hypothetical protein